MGEEVSGAKAHQDNWATWTAPLEHDVLWLKGTVNHLYDSIPLFSKYENLRRRRRKEKEDLSHASKGDHMQCRVNESLHAVPFACKKTVLQNFT